MKELMNKIREKVVLDKYEHSVRFEMCDVWYFNAYMRIAPEELSPMFFEKYNSLLSKYGLCIYATSRHDMNNTSWSIRTIYTLFDSVNRKFAIPVAFSKISIFDKSDDDMIFVCERLTPDDSTTTVVYRLLNGDITLSGEYGGCSTIHDLYAVDDVENGINNS